MDDYYEILGVARDATSHDIKRAFRQIARECHPDVAGGDLALEERFKNARKAYETLMDPVARARYDRRGQRKGMAPPAGGSFFDAFYKATGRAAEERPGPERPPPSGPRPPTGRKNPGNQVSLDDLFNDFGDFGFDAGRASAGARPAAADPGARAAPLTGDDVHVDLEVPADVAREGGSVTAVYHRLQRSDSWRPGQPDPGLVRVQDIADIRIIPGTRGGEVLRERGLGDAGAHGGAYGDLVATVRVVAARPPPPPRSAPPPPEPEPAPARDGEVRTLDIGVVEALLGGRVSLPTPQGRVRISIPPGTSGGSRLRLKGRGPLDAAGRPTDLYVVTRIVVPRELDAESRRLIEEFARLNPSAHLDEEP